MIPNFEEKDIKASGLGAYRCIIPIVGDGTPRPPGNTSIECFRSIFSTSNGDDSSRAFGDASSVFIGVVGFSFGCTGTYGNPPSRDSTLGFFLTGDIFVSAGRFIGAPDLRGCTFRGLETTGSVFIGLPFCGGQDRDFGEDAVSGGAKGRA